jgi:hypothetical protein
MAWKRYSDEDALKNLLEIEVHLLGDMDVLSTCHTKPTPTFFTKKRKAYPAPPRSGRLAWFLVGALPQPFSLDISFEPRPVVRLTAEALSLGCMVLGLVGWNAALKNVDGHSLLKCFDVMDESKICGGGSAHELPSHSLLRFGSLIPSTISRFCASLIPAE